jgi:hypothetical protein
MFTELEGWNGVLRSDLLAITRPDLRANVRGDGEFVGVHVRRGDFGAVDEDRLREGGSNLRVPIRWFLEAIRSVRRRYGYSLEARVFTDGCRGELEELLDEPNVSLMTGGTALEDLLSMANSRVLIGSSVFSMWACFLGEIPSVWYPGQKPNTFSGATFRRAAEWEYGEELRFP